MKKRTLILLLLLGSSIVACESKHPSTSTSTNLSSTSSFSTVSTPSSSPSPSSPSSPSSSSSTTTSTTINDGADFIVPDVPGNTVAPIATLPDVDEASLKGEYEGETTANIVLNQLEVTVTGTTANVKVSEDTSFGTIVEITKSGVYLISGTLSNGFISISKKELTVTLVLNGVNIYSPNFASIVCLKKSDVTIELATNSTNYLTDGGIDIDENGKYSIDYDGEEQPNATLLIRKNLLIQGEGSLIVNGSGNNGIGSRANLTIESGNITVNAKNNALKGNDSIAILGGNLNLSSLSDGIKNDSESEEGNIDIESATILINSKNDAIQALRSLVIESSTIQIKTGNTSTGIITNDSAKGLKAGDEAEDGTIIEGEIILLDNNIEIDSNDDCIHTNNGNVDIISGSYILSSGDDGIHADKTVTISGGNISISKSYEGIEGLDVIIEGGNLSVKATDDGINVAGGSSTNSNTPTNPGSGRPGNGGNWGGQSSSSGGTLSIIGGNIYVEASGDGLDSNGNLSISGGTIQVAQTGSGNEPLDYDGTLSITGGIIIAYGSKPMSAIGSTAQVTLTLSKQIAKDTELVLKQGDTPILSWTSKVAASYLVLSSPLLQKGITYTLYGNGSQVWSGSK